MSLAGIIMINASNMRPGSPKRKCLSAGEI